MVCALAGAVLVLTAATHAQPPVPITYDTYLEGEISTTVEVDRYVFSGVAGEHIILRVQSTGDSYFNTKVELYDPSGALDTVRYDHSDYYADVLQIAFVDYVLEQTGTYVIHVSERDGAKTSPYWLSLQSREDIRARAKSIAYDTCFAADTISARGRVNGYTFSGNAGEHITVRARPFGDQYFNIKVEISGPGGGIDTVRYDHSNYYADILQVAFVDYALDQTGTYTIYVSERDGGRTCPYWMTLQSLEHVMANAKPIVLDSTYSSSINPMSDQDAYSFDAVANDRVSIRLKPASSASSILIVYAPDNSILYNDTVGGGGLNALENYQLPASGTYKARILGGGGEETFDYTFAVYGMMLQHDAVAAEVVVPDSIIAGGIEIEPAAIVRNFGMTRDTLRVYFRIDSVYVDSTTKVLNPYQSDTIRFALWTPPEENAAHTAVCSVAVPDETHLANNVVSRNFFVLESTVYIDNIVFSPASPDTIDTNQTVTISFDYNSMADSILIYCLPYSGDTYAPACTVSPSPYYMRGNGSGTTSFAIDSGCVDIDSVMVYAMNKDQSEVLYRVFLPEIYAMIPPASIDSIMLDPSSPDTLQNGEPVTVSFRYTTVFDSVLVFCVPVSGDSLPRASSMTPSALLFAGTDTASASFTIDSGYALVDSIFVFMTDIDTSEYLYGEVIAVSYIFGSQTAVAPQALRHLPTELGLSLDNRGSALIAVPTDAARVTIRAYDVSGRCVAVLYSGGLKAGHHTLRWRPSPGMYVVHLVTAEKTLVRSTTVVR